MLLYTILFACHGLVLTSVLSLIHNLGKDLQIKPSENVLPVDDRMGKWKSEEYIRVGYSAREMIAGVSCYHYVNWSNVQMV